MTALSPIIHALLAGADALDQVCDELPEPVCQDQRLLVAALARACQITAEKLKKTEAERERALMERVL